MYKDTHIFIGGIMSLLLQGMQLMIVIFIYNCRRKFFLDVYRCRRCSFIITSSIGKIIVTHWSGGNKRQSRWCFWWLLNNNGRATNPTGAGAMHGIVLAVGGICDRGNEWRPRRRCGAQATTAATGKYGSGDEVLRARLLITVITRPQNRLRVTGNAQTGRTDCYAAWNTRWQGERIIDNEKKMDVISRAARLLGRVNRLTRAMNNWNRVFSVTRAAVPQITRRGNARQIRRSPRSYDLRKLRNIMISSARACALLYALMYTCVCVCVF